MGFSLFLCITYIYIYIYILIQDQDFGEKYHDGDVEYAASDVDDNEQDGGVEEDGLDEDKDRQQDDDDGDDDGDGDDDEQAQDNAVDKYEDVNDANIKGPIFTNTH